MYDLIFNVLLYVALPLACGFYLYEIILKPNIQGARNRRQPVITTRAEVVGRAKNLDNVAYSSFYTRDGGDVHMLLFRTAEGNEVTLTVPRILYSTLPDGTNGTLIYQGTKCERFDADET